VLFLNRYREVVDDASEYLEKLSNSIELLALVDETQENAIYLIPDIDAQAS
jgi:hypothetical protein